MSLFRDLIKSALDCDLSKNEYKAFLGLLHQTLGYGKASDNLTDNRLSSITGVRKDRLRKAVDGVVACGLFDVKEHARFDYCYTFGLSFLNAHTGAFFTPSLPKNGRNFRKTETFSENRVHTNTNQYLSKPSQLQTNTESVALSGDSDAKSTESVAFNNNGGGGNTESVAFNDNGRIENTESVAIKPLQPSVVFELPKQIPNENKAVCQRILAKLSVDQRNKTLQVFSSMAIAGKVRKPTGLLITLAKAAKQGTLILPDAEVCSAPLHPSHIAFDKQQISSRERALERSADLAFMQLQASLQGKPLHEIAVLYGKQDILREVSHV